MLNAQITYIIFRSMRITHILVLIFALLYLTAQTHKIKELSSLSVGDLEEDDLVEVVETSDNRPQNNKIMPHYYVIRVIHKEKKQAYMKMQAVFKNVVTILLKNRIIPDEESLVKSRIKPQYFSKKRSWSFSTIFVIFGNDQQLQKCYKQFSRLHIQRLSTMPSINFLNEKVVALEVFNNAKEKLTKQLERFGEFEIKEVVEIEIKGSQVENSDILEIQLEEEFNESEEVINEDEIIEGAIETDKQPLEMKIVFRVGRYNEDYESDGDNDEDDTYEEDDQTNQSEESM